MLKNFVRIKASPLKNSKFFYSTPKEILNFYNLSLEKIYVGYKNLSVHGAALKFKPVSLSKCQKEYVCKYST